MLNLYLVNTYGKEYAEGWKAFRDINKTTSYPYINPQNPYMPNTQEYNNWKRGADASEAAWHHNSGGDWH